jgi:hypothetical protein
MFACVSMAASSAHKHTAGIAHRRFAFWLAKDRCERPGEKTFAPENDAAP